MYKFVLIAALALASASAQAGQSRGLTLASNDEPVATTQPAPAVEPAAAAAATSADAPKYVERPSAVDTKATPDQPKVDAKGDSNKGDSKPVVKAEKKRHHESTEARVIYELHRHGIYW